MIDIDELERIVRAGDRYGHNTPGVTLELIAEVRALRAGEPNMRHPKIQHLISQKARQSIELNMIERMIDEPDFEYCGSDYDYTTRLTEKVEAFVKAARGAK